MMSMTLPSPGGSPPCEPGTDALLIAGGIINEFNDALRLDGIETGGVLSCDDIGGRPRLPADAGDGSGAMPCTSCLCFFR